MYKIQTLNSISELGLERFPRAKYSTGDSLVSPDAYLVRSAAIKPEDLGANLKAIARAGAGVDKICVADCTQKGIPVFNTPGANANSVKELVMLAMLLSSRKVIAGVNFVRELYKTQELSQIHSLVEKGKKNYGGNELAGKTLGVVGLGAIGSLVADMGLAMGMKVLGYDPAISVEAAWKLSNKVVQMENLGSLLGKSDYVSLHVPMLDATKNMINTESLKMAKPGLRLLNFARAGIVEEAAVAKALDQGILSKFVADFPYDSLMDREECIFLPHLGASTQEAEDNCAVMAANQLKDFLEHGNIINSVNFPRFVLERSGDQRIAFANRNVPGVLRQVQDIIGETSLNITGMLNKSRGEIAYSAIDVEGQIPPAVLEKIQSVDGILSLRVL